MIEAVLTILMFLGASILDLRERRVANRYWLPFLISGALILLSTRVDVAVLLWIVIQWALFYVLWRMGLLFGGADAKALMVLAILWPGLPSAGSITPAIDTLVNALLVMLALPLGFLLWNGVRGKFHPAMALAIPMDLRRAQSRFVWPMERVRHGKIRLKFMQSRGENIQHVYRELKTAGVHQIWATPKVPFMVPLLIGAGLAWCHGNVLFYALEQVLSP